MRLTLDAWTRFWPYPEPFALSRGAKLGEDSIQVRLTDELGRPGRGEAVGVTYAGESTATMLAQLEAVRAHIEEGTSRSDLLSMLPHGGARMALDAALWDLEAKQGGPDPFAAAGLRPEPVTSMCTIGIKSLEGYAMAARALADYPYIKVKVDACEPMAVLALVAASAPRARLIVDPNQSWSVEQLKALAPDLQSLGVILVEQPIPVGDEAGLDGWTSPVRLCADELVNTVADLDKALGRFDVINIKLDKAGGLTAALALADAVQMGGFGLMVGCMMGSSLSMAPAMVLAQRAEFVDLDGPLLHSEDVEHGFVYRNGTVLAPHIRELWG
jgi:L-alanine-DL-glutamate epimerase-like enolase superfamily enzyme